MSLTQRGDCKNRFSRGPYPRPLRRPPVPIRPEACRCIPAPLTPRGLARNGPRAVPEGRSPGLGDRGPGLAPRAGGPPALAQGTKEQASGHGRGLGPEDVGAQTHQRVPARSPPGPIPLRGPPPRRAPRRWGARRRAGPGPGARGRPVGDRSSRPPTPTTSGSQQRRLWAAASRATRRSRSRARSRRSPSHRTTARGRLEHDDPVDPGLGELLHHPLGPLPLHRHEPDGHLGRDRADGRRPGPSGSRIDERPRPPAPVNRQAATDPRRRRPPPSRRRADAGHRAEVMGVVGRRARGASRSATKTWAAAPSPAGVIGHRSPDSARGRRPVRQARGVQPNAERRRDMSPSSGGADLLAALGREPPEELLLRLRQRRSGVSTTTWTRRSPRPRPRTWGTPRPAQPDHDARLGAGGARPASRCRRASRRTASRPARPGPSTRGGRRAGRRPTRTKTSSGRTDRCTYRSPGGPPAVPGRAPAR